MHTNPHWPRNLNCISNPNGNRKNTSKFDETLVTSCFWHFRVISCYILLCHTFCYIYSFIKCRSQESTGRTFRSCWRLWQGGHLRLRWHLWFHPRSQGGDLIRRCLDEDGPLARTHQQHRAQRRPGGPGLGGGRCQADLKQCRSGYLVHDGSCCFMMFHDVSTSPSCRNMSNQLSPF